MGSISSNKNKIIYDTPAKHITLNVCQGIGDIFWVYQKFSPYYEVINFKICQIGNSSKIGTRAIPFLKTLPKTGTVDIHGVTTTAYDKMVKTRYRIEDVIKAAVAKPNNSFDYACNKPLEDGVRIEEIDRLFPIEETVAMKIGEFALPYSNYICVYVSGSTTGPNSWNVQTWAKFVKKLYEKWGISTPIIMIGASYDEQVTKGVKELLVNSNLNVTCYIDLPPESVSCIIKNAACFVGFQSGLNVLADNLDTPQIMIYYQSLTKMQYSWCKKKNMEAKVFNSGLFNEKCQDIVNRLDELYLNVKKKL